MGASLAFAVLLTPLTRGAERVAETASPLLLLVAVKAVADNAAILPVPAGLVVRAGIYDFLATVETIGCHMMTAMCLT